MDPWPILRAVYTACGLAVVFTLVGVGWAIVRELFAPPSPHA